MNMRIRLIYTNFRGTSLRRNVYCEPFSRSAQEGMFVTHYGPRDVNY
jgi:hypothetical protein